MDSNTVKVVIFARLSFRAEPTKNIFAGFLIRAAWKLTHIAAQACNTCYPMMKVTIIQYWPEYLYVLTYYYFVLKSIQNMHRKIGKYFRGFKKINAPWIFPLLQ